MHRKAKKKERLRNRLRAHRNVVKAYGGFFHGRLHILSSRRRGRKKWEQGRDGQKPRDRTRAFPQQAAPSLARNEKKKQMTATLRKTSKKITTPPLSVSPFSLSRVPDRPPWPQRLDQLRVQLLGSRGDDPPVHPV